ncbi:hypothetical protein CVS40_9368 [Lucilia cuprina]|nr:hypothetical protein CVS40_9368 [Lucilia cuprina]
MSVLSFKTNGILDVGLLNEREHIMEFVDVAFLMTKRYISPNTNTVIITGQCDYLCEEMKKYYSILVYNVMKKLKDTLSVQLFLVETDDRPWDYNIFVVDSLLKFSIPYSNHERHFYFFILLTWSSEYQLDHNLLEIFEICLNFNVENVVVMVKSRLYNYFSFYSYELYNSNMCSENIMVREINRYENGHLKFDLLFPIIESNFFGCPVKMSAELIQPFITFDGDLENKTHLIDMKRLGGIEGEILKLIAEALNFKIHMRFSREFSIIGLHYNSTGCLSDLEYRRSKIAIGGLSSTMEYHHLFTKSVVYHTTPYKFVVRNDIYFGPIKQLINPLDRATWIIILIFFSVAIFLIQTIIRYKMTQLRDLIFGIKNRSPTFYLIITFLGYGMSNQIIPKRNFARFILMSWLLLAFEIRTGYLGKMFDSLRLGKRMPVPETIAQLIARDYTLLNPMYTSFYPKNKTIIKQNRFSILQQVQTSDKPLTGAVILDFWAYYKFQNRSITSLIPVAETIHSYQCVMYFNKHSLLQVSFDKKLKLLTDSGITAHIAKRHVHSNFKSVMNSQSQNHFLGLYDDRVWDFNIFIVDSYESFHLPTTHKERFFYFFILLTWNATNEDERNEALRKIFDISLSYNIRNVVVLNKAINGNYFSFYTYELFNTDQCENKIIIREINRYENETLQNQFLFPDYRNDYQGCLINVSAREMPPLLTFNGDINNETHLMEINRLDGIEGDILKLIADALQIKIRLKFPQEVSKINPFLDSAGCFADLDYNWAQLAIGGFSSTLSSSDKYSTSLSYHATPYVFVVRSGLCFGPIEQLLNPLCTSTWIFVLVLIIVLIIFTKIVQMKPKVRDFVFGPKMKEPIYSMFVIFLGYSLSTQILPKRNFARYLLISWLLLSFQIRNGYQGKMFDSLRFCKRIPVPQKISQLIEQDYFLLTALPNIYYPSNKTQIFHNTTKRLNILQNTTLQLTVTALLDSLAYYNYMNSNISTLTYVEETIYSYPFVMFFKKHSLLRTIVDRKLKIFSDAGITSYIAKRHTRSKFQSMNSGSQFVSRLTNENLKGLYHICGAMFLISIFVFLLELLTRKSKRLQKIMDGFY